MHAFDVTYLAPRDVGRRFGITTSGVIQLVLRGQLRDIRDSAGRRFFHPADVEELAKQRESRRRQRRK